MTEAGYPKPFTSKLLAFFAGIGVDPDDSEALRLKKALLVGWAVMFIPVGLIWGAIYFAFGEPIAGLIPSTYALITLISFILYYFTRQFIIFRTSQMILVLILPFLLMLALGGYIASSAVVIWAMISPFGATLIGNRWHARRLLLGYLGLLILGAVLQPYLRGTNNLPAWLVIAFFVLNLGTVPAFVYILLDYFIGQRDTAYRLLSLEQEKSERLLLNVLPTDVAASLKETGEAPPQRYEQASIMYADMVGFTRLSAEMTPEATVDLLNEIYSYFDSLVEKHGVEKIRTIGDNYMVVSGVPNQRPDHAAALARMAVELSRYMDAQYSENPRKLKFRVGINSGPVVAGVVGKKTFQYDVWGEAVNTASRMESQGVPGRVHISGATHRLLEGQFVSEPRGEIEIKGVGQMETWFLVGEA